jgi:hypothetical protein
MEKNIQIVKLYKRRINERVVVSICREEHINGLIDHKNFLTLEIRDELLDKDIHLKLSTFRRIVKFVDKHRFMKARRLTWIEKKVINRRRG